MRPDSPNSTARTDEAVRETHLMDRAAHGAFSGLSGILLWGAFKLRQKNGTAT